MGELIRKDAAVGDIIVDLKATLTNSVAKGGDWDPLARERLGPVVALADTVEARLAAARRDAAPIFADLEMGNDVADRLLRRIADDVWNLVGRPAVDPALDILFPGGSTYYADGPVADQPIRMGLLAELLEAGIHKRLDATKAAGFATEIRASAVQLEEKVDAARPFTARIELAGKMQGAIARVGQIVLSRLKRQWLADGNTEAEIHTVIPDRPTRKQPKGGGGGPTGA